MFTGLIETVGVVAERRRDNQDFSLRIKSGLPSADLVLGESIAVNGVCLTVTQIGADHFTAQASAETLRRTNIGDLNPGSRVNLERALRLGDRLGGHLVLGHVDATGVLVGLRREGNSTHVRVTAPPSCMDLIVEKGSITLDGISLTVNKLLDDSFEVTVVPWTSKHVALTDRPKGWKVNLEVDVLGRYVARLLSRGFDPQKASAPEAPKGGVTRSLLARSGFLSDF